jgi:group I intron endonuclease
MVYENAKEGLKKVRLQFKGIAGFYGLLNLKTGQIYIGSAKDLAKRPEQHTFSSKITNVYLWNAIQKYGLHSFCLVIFGVLGPSSKVNKKDLIIGEDIYLSTINSSILYNFLLKAYNSLGYKHSAEAIIKIKTAATG